MNIKIKLLNVVLFSTLLSIAGCAKSESKIDPSELILSKNFIHDDLCFTIIYLKDGRSVLLLTKQLDYFLKKYNIHSIYADINKQDVKYLPFELIEELEEIEKLGLKPLLLP